jgi:hypothetical protein
MGSKEKNYQRNFNPTHRCTFTSGKPILVEIVRDCGAMLVVAGEDGQPFSCPNTFLEELREAA